MLLPLLTFLAACVKLPAVNIGNCASTAVLLQSVKNKRFVTPLRRSVTAHPALYCC